MQHRNAIQYNRHGICNYLLDIVHNHNRYYRMDYVDRLKSIIFSHRFFFCLVRYLLGNHRHNMVTRKHNVDYHLREYIDPGWSMDKARKYPLEKRRKKKSRYVFEVLTKKIRTTLTTVACTSCWTSTTSNTSIVVTCSSITIIACAWIN